MLIHDNSFYLHNNSKINNSGKEVIINEAQSFMRKGSREV